MFPPNAPAEAHALVVARGRPGRFAIALKSTIGRAGRWALPGRSYCVVYKGSGLLDLRAARLTSDVTTICAVSYKSRTEIVLPPGVRLELGGTGVSAAGDAPASQAPARAPLVRVKGVAYRGTIEVRTGPGPGVR